MYSESWQKIKSSPGKNKQLGSYNLVLILSDYCKKWLQIDRNNKGYQTVLLINILSVYEIIGLPETFPIQNFYYCLIPQHGFFSIVTLIEVAFKGS